MGESMGVVAFCSQRGWRRARSGLTLMELMIVMALMLALVSVVTPLVFSRLQSSVFDETVRQLGSSLSLCRTDARLTGHPVRLVAVTGEDGLVVLVGVPMTSRSERDSAPADGGRDAGTVNLAGLDLARTGRRYLVLPRGYRLTRDLDGDQLTEALQESAALTDAFVPVPDPGFDPGGLGDGDRRALTPPLTIAVFLPDGSALTGDPVRMVAANGVMLDITIGAWTGAASLEVVHAGNDALMDDPFDDLLPMNEASEAMGPGVRP